MLAAPFLMELKTFILNANNFSCWKDDFILRQWLFERLYWIWMNYSDFFFSIFPLPLLKKNERELPTKATSGKMKLVQKWWYLISFFVYLSYFSGQEQYLLLVWHPAQMGPTWPWTPMLLEDTVTVSWLCKFTAVIYWPHCCHHISNRQKNWW